MADEGLVKPFAMSSFLMNMRFFSGYEKSTMILDTSLRPTKR